MFASHKDQYLSCLRAHKDHWGGKDEYEGIGRVGVSDTVGIMQGAADVVIGVERVEQMFG